MNQDQGLANVWVALLTLLAMVGCQRPADPPAGAMAAGLPASSPNRTAESIPAAVDSWNPVFVDLDGIEHRPFDNERAKVVALIFIMPDCPIVNSYAPELNRLHESYVHEGVKLLLVHVDPDLTLEQAREHAEQYELRVPILLDSQHVWVKMAGATRTPEAAVLSPRGDLLYRGRIDDRYVDWGKRRTEVTSRDFRDALDAILADRAVPQPRTEAVGCFIPESNGE